MNLFTKANDLGIQPGFIDALGNHRVTSATALKIIIDALPPRAPHRLLDEAVVIRSGRPGRTALKQAATFPLHWKIVAGSTLLDASSRTTNSRLGSALNRTGECSFDTTYTAEPPPKPRALTLVLTRAA